MAESVIVPVDKPAGPTSHDIVAGARRALGSRRIGHTGTLDPFASGLLLLCVEAATRLAEYLTHLPKRYRATARLDGATLTDDVTGEFTSRSDAWRATAPDEVRAAFARQRGTRLQKPSSFSAKKVGGERAYDLARRGETVELAPAEVTVFDIRIGAMDLPMIEFEVDCSSGTYVRAIARDVGLELGTGGYLTALRRTAIGRFAVERALTPAELADGDLVSGHAISMLEAVGHLETIAISEEEEQSLRFGRWLPRAAPTGTVALAREGRLVAIAHSDGVRINPRKVFALG